MWIKRGITANESLECLSMIAHNATRFSPLPLVPDAISHMLSGIYDDQRRVLHSRSEVKIASYSSLPFGLYSKESSYQVFSYLKSMCGELITGSSHNFILIKECFDS